jgi:hypothetical protein
MSPSRSCASWLLAAPAMTFARSFVIVCGLKTAPSAQGATTSTIAHAADALDRHGQALEVAAAQAEFRGGLDAEIHAKRRLR